MKAFRNNACRVAIGLLALSLCPQSHAQKIETVQLFAERGANDNFSAKLVLNEGDLAEQIGLHGWMDGSSRGVNGVYRLYSLKGKTLEDGIGDSRWGTPDGNGDKFGGPAEIQISYPLSGNKAAWCVVVFKVTRGSDTGSSGTSGGTAATQYATVIPENLSSDVRLRLQQSTDLINWTDVQPGDFTPSAQKRFFRVNSEVIRTVAITGATSANPIVVTAPAHGFSAGNQVQISGAQGNASANGTFTITVVDANTFSLNGADGSAAAAYTSGGTAKKL
jgi:hypothetical protein